MNRHLRRKETAALKARKNAERKHAIKTLNEIPIDLNSDRVKRAVKNVATKLKQDGEPINVFFSAVAELVIVECYRIGPTSFTNDDFFERPINNEPVNWQYQSRITSIADTLFNLYDCEGFGLFCRKLHYQNVRSVFFEAFAAGMMKALGYKISFQQEVRVKGRDFDFVSTKDDRIINCEVTALTSDRFSVKSISNALHKKRKQLPSENPAVIFVIIPEDWIVNNNDEVQNCLRDAASELFERSQRINAIVYLNELHEDHGLQIRGNLEFQFQACVTSEPRYEVPELLGLIDGTLDSPDLTPTKIELESLQNFRKDTPFFQWAQQIWDASGRPESKFE